MKPFEILSFNILGDWDEREGAAWDIRGPRVARAISEADPDLVGLQEVTFAQRRSLDSQLPGLTRVPIEAHAREVIPHTDDPLNTILFRPSRFRLERCGVFWLGRDPARPSCDWEAAFPRCATWARFVDQADGEPLLFISTHFDHDSEMARLESATLVSKFVAGAGRDGGVEAPAIVVGDFNSDASLEVHKRLVTGPPPLRDAWEQTNSGPATPYSQGTFHDFTGEALTEVGRIDWILFSPPLTPISTAVLDKGIGGRYPSDHFPVHSRFIRG